MADASAPAHKWYPSEQYVLDCVPKLQEITAEVVEQEVKAFLANLGADNLADARKLWAEKCGRAWQPSDRDVWQLRDDGAFFVLSNLVTIIRCNIIDVWPVAKGVRIVEDKSFYNITFQILSRVLTEGMGLNVKIYDRRLPYDQKEKVLVVGTFVSDEWRDRAFDAMDDSFFENQRDTETYKRKKLMERIEDAKQLLASADEMIGNHDKEVARWNAMMEARAAKGAKKARVEPDV
jgi:hypothetical protein